MYIKKHIAVCYVPRPVKEPGLQIKIVKPLFNTRKLSVLQSQSLLAMTPRGKSVALTANKFTFLYLSV